MGAWIQNVAKMNGEAHPKWDKQTNKFNPSFDSSKTNKRVFQES